MNFKSEWKKLLILTGCFLTFFFLPVGTPRFDNAVLEALHLAKWYAKEHVLLCLIPAFFIAGAIAVFVSQASVVKYLGGKSNKCIAYGVASVSGAVLAVCSCTVLPLFAGIYRMGAGLGPATAFLYSGPAINILAVVLTTKLLGLQLGVARALGAIFFSILIGILMHLIFIREEKEDAAVQMFLPEENPIRPLWQNSLYFASMTAILVFANCGKPEETTGILATIYASKWTLTSLSALSLGIILICWFTVAWWKVVLTATVVAALAFLFPAYPLLSFSAGIIGLSIITATDKDEKSEWFSASWGFAKQILPLLLCGVLIAGALLGRVGQEGLIPAEWITKAVGGNSLFANFFASFVGAFMYFATLTEIPILQGLIANGMGKGPALALLLAGPTLSLPNMFVIHKILGIKKTAVFISLVVIMATVSGILFGYFCS